MTHTIRRAQPTEAAALSELARNAKASWGYPAEWMEAWRNELTITPEYIATQQVFVADAGSGVAGMAALESADGRAVLEHLWVAASHQGQGLGKALVRHALREAARGGAHAVRVVADPNAATFYEGLGARVTGSEPAPMPGAPHRTLPTLELPTRGGARGHITA